MANAVPNNTFMPGYRLIRGEDLNSQLSNPNLSTQQSVTAKAGGTRAAAVAITAALTNVTVSATAGDSLVLPSAAAVLGQSYTIFNNGAAAATLYALASDTINGTAGATGVSIVPGGSITVRSVAAATWLSNAASGTQSSLVLAGATSGTTTVQASAVASGTLTLPAATDTLVGKATTDTLTNKTLTLPTIGGTGAVFNGSTSGTTTLLASAIAGSTTQTLPAVTGVLASTTGTNLFVADLKRTTASVTANATTTYANVTGLSFTVVPGTYAFDLELPSTVASGTGGIKYAFNYTTTVVSVLQASGVGCAAAAVACQQTQTTTTQTDIFTQAAVVLNTKIRGTMVVTTGGTVDVQMAQNTSNASNTIALIGGYGQFVRIA